MPGGRGRTGGGMADGGTPGGRGRTGGRAPAGRGRRRAAGRRDGRRGTAGGGGRTGRFLSQVGGGDLRPTSRVREGCALRAVSRPGGRSWPGGGAGRVVRAGPAGADLAGRAPSACRDITATWAAVGRSAGLAPRHAAQSVARPGGTASGGTASGEPCSFGQDRSRPRQAGLCRGEPCQGGTVSGGPWVARTVSGPGAPGTPSMLFVDVIPVRQAVNTTPRAYMSASGVAGPPTASSGAM